MIFLDAFMRVSYSIVLIGMLTVDGQPVFVCLVLAHFGFLGDGQLMRLYPLLALCYEGASTPHGDRSDYDKFE